MHQCLLRHGPCGGTGQIVRAAGGRRGTRTRACTGPGSGHQLDAAGVREPAVLGGRHADRALRRALPRLDHLRGRAQLRIKFCRTLPRDTELEVRLVDISATGCAFVTQKELATGEHACYRTRVGCLRICMHGPTMVVYPEGTWYHGMTKERIGQFVQQHLIEGKPIEEWIFARNPLDDTSEPEA